MKLFKQIFKHIIATMLALLSRLTLKKYHPKIVVVVGSVGKTSTKDAIFTATSAFLSPSSGRTTHGITPLAGSKFLSMEYS